MEPLEARDFFSADVSTIALHNPDGTLATIARHQPLWIVIHGLGSGESDPTIRQLAAAVQAGAPDDQTMILDWGTLANANQVPDGATAYENAWASADKIAAQLKRAHIPVGRINLIGFSMGGQLEERIAQDLNTATSKLNRLIAIDPAAPGYGYNRAGHVLRHVENFAADAAYSIAFCTTDTDSFATAGLSANDTVLLDGLTGNDVQRHVGVEYALTRLFRRDAGLEPTDAVSSPFSLANITAETLPAWRKDAYGTGYEAVMTCAADASDPPAAFVPASLVYFNHRGHRQTV